MGLNLQARVGLDGSGFEAGLMRLQRSVSNFKTIAGTAFGVFGIQQAIQKTLEYADSMVDLANRIGVTTEAMQEFAFAAEQSGTSTDKFVRFAETLAKNRKTKEGDAALGQLGVANVGTTDNLIMAIAQSVRGKSQASIINPLSAVGGRGAGEMINMLQGNLEELRKQANELGIVIDKQTLVSLKAANDQLKIFSKLLISTLAPAISMCIDMLVQLANQVRANITFWKVVAPKTTASDWFQASFGLLGMKPRPGSDAEKALNKVNAAMAEGGEASLTELETGQDRIAKMKEALLKAQLAIESVNGNSGLGTGYKKTAGSIYSDSLVGAGNFLGSNLSGVQNVMNDQLNVLRQIERNTSPMKTGGSDYD